MRDRCAFLNNGDAPDGNACAHTTPIRTSPMREGRGPVAHPPPHAHIPAPEAPSVPRVKILGWYLTGPRAWANKGPRVRANKGYWPRPDPVHDGFLISLKACDEDRVSNDSCSFMQARLSSEGQAEQFEKAPTERRGGGHRAGYKINERIAGGQTRAPCL